MVYFHVAILWKKRNFGTATLINLSSYIYTHWQCTESESSFRHLAAASIVPKVVAETEISDTFEQWKLLTLTSASGK